MLLPNNIYLMIYTTMLGGVFILTSQSFKAFLFSEDVVFA